MQPISQDWEIMKKLLSPSLSSREYQLAKQSFHSGAFNVAVDILNNMPRELRDRPDVVAYLKEILRELDRILLGFQPKHSEELRNLVEQFISRAESIQNDPP